MYRILLADDEAIILSGLQSMLKWEDYNCTVVATARNGQQGWEYIQQYHPDIVICDIKMPIMSGLELLQRCSEEHPEIVFLMLTNYEDFSLARDSLRYRAVDYLLKIDLDEQKLSAAIDAAIRERKKRARLAKDSSPEPRESQEIAELIAANASIMLSGGGEKAHYARENLIRLGAAERCAVLELIMDPKEIPNISTQTAQDRERLFTFYRQLCEEMARKLFDRSHCLVLRSSGKQADSRMQLYLWSLEGRDQIDRFYNKLTAALSSISQMQISLLATQIVSGEQLRELPNQLAALRSEYQINPRSVTHFSQDLTSVDYVEAAKRYVHNHILERILVQDVAAALGITPNYLSSLFKRRLGQNFIDYVNAAKVEQACIMLRSGKYLVYEVSHALGYDNAYYFTKVFKKYRNMTPTEYQDMVGQTT